MKDRKFRSKRERGVALLIALFALLLLSAIAFAMMFMADTETAVNDNYRSSQKAYFAAEAGLEEARDRLRWVSVPAVAPQITPPSALPGGVCPGATCGVTYLLNPAGAADVVQPWNAANRYFDDELCHDGFPGLGLANPGTNIPCAAAPAGNTWYTTVASNAPFANTQGALTYKWVRITLKTNGSVAPFYVNGSNAAGTLGTMVCWDGGNEVLLPVGKATCAAADYERVYMVTALAVTPTGARRLVASEVVPPITIPIAAAIYTKLASAPGDALNVTGNQDPICAMPPVIGVASGTSTVTIPGGGNITGSPPTVNNAGWGYNLPAMIASQAAYSSPIDSAGTGVTGAGSPVAYTGVNATLGIAPTVTYDSNGAISAVTTPGTPRILYSPGNLTLGGPSMAGAPVSGSGVLLVNGNLTVDVSHGFNYFGLIVVTGNITFVASPGALANPHIHGAVLGGGTFAMPVSNFGGSVSVHADACMVNQTFRNQPMKYVVRREAMY